MPITHDVEQRSSEWYEIRAKCLCTASDAGPWLIGTDKVSVKARRKRVLRFIQNDAYATGDERLQAIVAKERKALDYDLAVQRGIHFEDEAFVDFEKFTGLETEKVGIITSDDGLFGASIDRRIVGMSAFAEGKVPLPETHLAYVLENQENGGMIAEYQWQMDFTLAVTEFHVGHFWSYPVPYYKAGRLVQEPQLWIEVRPSKRVDEIKKGMAAMAAELKRTHAVLASIAARQAKGENTAIHSLKF